MGTNINILQAFTPTVQSVQRQQANQTNNDNFAQTLNQKMSELSAKQKQESKPNKAQNSNANNSVKDNDNAQIADVAPANPEDVVIDLPTDGNTGKDETEQVSAEVIEVAVTAQMLPLMEAFAKPVQGANVDATTAITTVDAAKAVTTATATKAMGIEPAQTQITQAVQPKVAVSPNIAAPVNTEQSTVEAKPQETIKSGVLVADNAVVEPQNDGKFTLEGMENLTHEGGNTAEINQTVNTTDKDIASQPIVETKPAESKQTNVDVKAEVITNTSTQKATTESTQATASTAPSAMILPKTNADGMTVRVSTKEDLEKAAEAETAPVDMQTGDEPVVTKVKTNAGEMQSGTEDDNADTDEANTTGKVLTSEHEAFTLQADRRIVTISDIAAKIDKLNSTPKPEVQLAEAIKTNLQSGRTEFEMQLAPISLGKITIKLIAEKGIMSVELRADNPKTQALLMQNSGEIRDLIQNANQQTQVVTPNQAENLPRNYQEGHRNQQQQQQNQQQQQAQEQDGETTVSADFLTLLQQLKNQSTMMKL